MSDSSLVAEIVGVRQSARVSTWRSLPNPLQPQMPRGGNGICPHSEVYVPTQIPP